MFIFKIYDLKLEISILFLFKEVQNKPSIYNLTQTYFKVFIKNQAVYIKLLGIGYICDKL